MYVTVRRRESLKLSEDFKVTLERRKTLNFQFASVGVEKLYGNLFMDYEGILFNFGFKDASTFDDFIGSLKSYRLNSKNYANMFLTKARVLIDILHSLLSNLDKSMQTAFTYYEQQVIYY